MTRNRRAFLKSIPATIALGTTAVAADSQPPAFECLDYGLSFIGNKATFNAVRFWIESRTTVIDEASETTQIYYQCGSCKSENTFADENLFAENNYDFLPILGGRNWLIFRRPSHVSETYRQVKADVWGEPVLKLRYGKGVTELVSFDAIREATEEGRPIVAQTEIRNETTRQRAVIEYPVKTMNVSLDDSVYQVDTGPIAYPDLTRPFEPPIECLSLAFVAFNAPHFADFIVEQPTPVVSEEQESAKTYHYSQPFSLPARNRLLALALPG